MKSNQKGFTLIELLAVIVILAIIALITTPIVLDLISNARADAAKNKLYGVLDAVRLAYTQNQVSDNPETGSTITHNFGGDNPLKFANKENGTSISISGESPTGGTVTINTETGTITATGILFEGFTCSTNADSKATCNVRQGS